jgi:general stress protein YciG
MTPAQLAEVGRRGGRKSQQKGTGYRWTTREQQSAAGARGGQVTGARAHEQRVRTKRQTVGQLPKLPGVPRTR